MALYQVQVSEMGGPEYIHLSNVFDFTLILSFSWDWTSTGTAIVLSPPIADLYLSIYDFFLFTLFMQRTL